MLIFQNSRRQLLLKLMSIFHDAKDHREQHEESGKPKNETEARKIDSLLKAVEAAEGECTRLEYYSDIRKLTEEGASGLEQESVVENDQAEASEKGKGAAQA